MAARSNPAAGEAVERKVTITRVFDAPRALVFKMWTDPKHVAQWWGPQGFTNPVCEVDARVGGRMRIVMHGPKGTDYDMDFPMEGEFREIVPPQRLVFTTLCPGDMEGSVLIEGLTTVTFVEEGGKTRVTIEASATAYGPTGAQMLAGMDAGWTQSIEKLEAYLRNT